jgi:peptidoglycan/xylan/chitin deacetylase (PgdA/CDA1 family)
MNKRIFLICALLTGLILTSCKPSDKRIITAKKTESQQTENTAAQIYAKQEVPVLCYHRISEGNKGDYTVSPATFSAHMKILADSGYHSVSPTELYDYLVFNKALPEKPVLITFDDSRIEHSAIAAPVMEKYGFKGTFFIMTITYNKKNYMTTEQIAALAKAGHTIGLHTWDHTMVSKFKDTTDWQKQIANPKLKLEKIVAMPVEYFAYPNGVYNHEGAKGLSKYFKISFILATKRDSLVPLQTVRRMIVPDWSAESMLRSMRRTFKTN